MRCGLEFDYEMGTLAVFAFGVRVHTFALELISEVVMPIGNSILCAVGERDEALRNIKCAVLGLPEGIRTGMWKWVRVNQTSVRYPLPTGPAYIAESYYPTLFPTDRMCDLQTACIGGDTLIRVGFAPEINTVFYMDAETKEGK